MSDTYTSQQLIEMNGDIPLTIGYLKDSRLDGGIFDFCIYLYPFGYNSGAVKENSYRVGSEYLDDCYGGVNFGADNKQKCLALARYYLETASEQVGRKDYMLMLYVDGMEEWFCATSSDKVFKRVVY